MLKASKYNVVFRDKDGFIFLFNSVTTALAELEPDKWPLVKKFLDDPNMVPANPEEASLLESLKYGGFIIESDWDEILYLKAKIRNLRFNHGSFGLTVCPTMNCNFRCPYCYEVLDKVVMSSETQKSLIRFVERRIEGVQNNFQVAWYGGEPLLAFNVVVNLSKHFLEIADKNKLHYEASIYTNGYLLDKDISVELPKLGVHYVQVTLDGPPEIHNKRRKLANGKGTFEKILENIKNAVRHLQVLVRVNVDKENASSIPELLEILEHEGLKNKIQLYMTPTSEYSEVCSAYMIEKGFLPNEGLKRIIELIKYAVLERGWHIPVMPIGSNRVCGAEAHNWFIVLPDGSLHKCWLLISKPDESFGNVSDLPDDHRLFGHTNYSKWLLTEPFEDPLCKECVQLPYCLGECAYSSMKRRVSKRCCLRDDLQVLKEFAFLTAHIRRDQNARAEG